MAFTLTAYIPNSKITTVTAPGFVDTTSYLTQISGIPDPDPSLLVLGSGFIIGQLKKIQLVDLGGGSPPVVTVSSNHFLDGPDQTIEFSAVGDIAELMWTRNGWRIFSTSNILGTDASPTVS